MTDTLNFNEARALKEGNAKLWTPLDCLKAIVRDLESGELKSVDAVYVAMVRKNEDGGATAFPFYMAGSNPLEMRGVLTQHVHSICSAFER